MMVALGDMDIMAVLSDTTNVIAEGEVLQLSEVGNKGMNEGSYLKVIDAKTLKSR